jgi:hypothetical protein
MGLGCLERVGIPLVLSEGTPDHRVAQAIVRPQPPDGVEADRTSGLVMLLAHRHERLVDSLEQDGRRPVRPPRLAVILGVRAGRPGRLVAAAPSAARHAGRPGGAARSALGRPGALPQPRLGRADPAITARPAVRPRAAGPRPRGAPGSGAVSHRRTVKSPEPDARVVPSGLSSRPHPVVEKRRSPDSTSHTCRWLTSRGPRQRRPRRGGGAHGVSFTRRPWTGRPAWSTNRIQPSHCPLSFTTLNNSTLTPRSRLKGPIMFSHDTSRISRFW